MTAEDERARTSVLEWVAAAIGLVLLLCVVAVIGREAVLGESSQPPSIVIETKRIVNLQHGFLVEFDATNHSSGTAAAVTVEGQLMTDRQPETATATLDYVAGNARVKGGLFFARDPRRGTLQLRALGYQEP